MNRRSFLKRFSAAVVGTVALATVPFSSPLVEQVVVAKATTRPLAECIEVHANRTLRIRITKLQYLFREKSFRDNGYKLVGNTLVPDYNRYYDFEDD